MPWEKKAVCVPAAIVSFGAVFTFFAIFIPFLTPQRDLLKDPPNGIRDKKGKFERVSSLLKSQ